MIHFLLPGITRPYSHFPIKADSDENQDYCHKLVIRLHRVCDVPAYSSDCKTVKWDFDLYSMSTYY